MIAPKIFQECRGGFALPWLPSLETERLVLRQPQLDDAGMLAEHLNRFQVARMLPSLPFPYDRQDALEWLLPRASGVLSGWTLIVSRAGGADMGVVSIERMGEDWVLGYWLAPQFWGERYGREAVEAVVSTFFAQAPEETLFASMLSDNPASFRILAGLGFRVTGCREVFCQARGEMKTLIEARLDGKHYEGR